LIYVQTYSSRKERDVEKGLLPYLTKKTILQFTGRRSNKKENGRGRECDGGDKGEGFGVRYGH